MQGGSGPVVAWPFVFRLGIGSAHFADDPDANPGTEYAERYE